MQATTIVVTSGKGGVGKTTVTANLGMALAKQGFHVCLIDTDTGLRNLDLLLGVEQRVIFDLVDVAEGRCRPEQALIHDRRSPNLCVLPTSQRHDKSALGPDDLRAVVATLRPRFDFVLLDCPAGIEEGFKTAIAAADRALVVLNPEVSSVRDADRVLGMLSDHGIRDVRLVLNRVREDMVARNDMISPEDVGELLRTPTLAVLPEDLRVVVSTNKGEPVALDRKARTGKLFEHMAKAVATNQLTIKAVVPEPVGMMGRLKSFLGVAAAAV